MRRISDFYGGWISKKDFFYEKTDPGDYRFLVSANQKMFCFVKENPKRNKKYVWSSMYIWWQWYYHLLRAYSLPNPYVTAIFTSFLPTEDDHGLAPRGSVMALTTELEANPHSCLFSLGSRHPGLLTAFIVSESCPLKQLLLETKSTLIEKYWKTFLKTDCVSPQGKWERLPRFKTKKVLSGVKVLFPSFIS